MQTTDILLFGAFAGLLAILSPLIGRWIADVMDGSPGRLLGFLKLNSRIKFGTAINSVEQAESARISMTYDDGLKKYRFYTV